MAAVTSRYARAFADVIASSRLDPIRTMDALEQLVELVSQSPQLEEVWSSPSVPHPQKLKLLDSVAGRLELGRQARNLIAVLIDHRRLRLLPEVVQQLKEELNDRMGMADAEITSARDLTDQERRQLEQRIAAATGKQIRARYSRDPGILGGAIVRVGSTVFDGSVRGQLQKMREEIAAL